MSIRSAVEHVLGADGANAAAPGDPRVGAALDEAGHGGLDPELYGEALVHFAETAPLDQADALAPIVRAASAVPIDDDLDPPVALDDLPTTPPTTDELDVSDDHDAVDDPDDLDGSVDLDLAAIEPPGAADGDAPAPVDDGFGTGSPSSVDGPGGAEEPIGLHDAPAPSTTARDEGPPAIDVDEPPAPFDPFDEPAGPETIAHDEDAGDLDESSGFGIDPGFDD